MTKACIYNVQYRPFFFFNSSDYLLETTEMATCFRAIAKKLKLVTFSRKWEIRLVFTKDRHHGSQKESLFLVQSLER